MPTSVLPAATQLEHLDVHTAYGHTSVLFNEPAIAPLGEALPNSEIFRRLAARMGFNDPCFADSVEQLARTALREVDFDLLHHQGWAQLPVPDATRSPLTTRTETMAFSHHCSRQTGWMRGKPAC